jgi:hypothetical protein
MLYSKWMNKRGCLASVMAGYKVEFQKANLTMSHYSHVLSKILLRLQNILGKTV